MLFWAFLAGTGMLRSCALPLVTVTQARAWTLLMTKGESSD